MDLKTTSAAAPFFFVFLFLFLMGLEFLVARFKGKNVYDFHDFYTNIGCSLGQQVFEVLSQAAMVGIYVFIYEKFSIFKTETNLTNFVVALVLVDLAYYTLHRLMHRVSLFWAVHVVHHQSKQFNLSLGLRLSWIHKLLTFPIYLPLAFLGIYPKLFIIAGALEIFYQFSTHTQVIKGIPIWDLVFVTPSLHRVHHGTNERYLNKNYGGILNIWDRLFRTYEKEGEPAVFGTSVPFVDRNPLTATNDFWRWIFLEFKASPSLRSAWNAFFQPPEQNSVAPALAAAVAVAPSEPGAAFVEGNRPGVIFSPAYIAINYALMIFMTLGFIYFSSRWSWWQRTPGVAVILFSLYSLGNCQDQAERAGKTETLRWVLCLLALLYYLR